MACLRVCISLDPGHVLELRCHIFKNLVFFQQIFSKHVLDSRHYARFAIRKAKSRPSRWGRPLFPKYPPK